MASASGSYHRPFSFFHRWLFTITLVCLWTLDIQTHESYHIRPLVHQSQCCLFRLEIAGGISHHLLFDPLHWGSNLGSSGYKSDALPLSHITNFCWLLSISFLVAWFRILFWAYSHQICFFQEYPGTLCWSILYIIPGSIKSIEFLPSTLVVLRRML